MFRGKRSLRSRLRLRLRVSSRVRREYASFGHIFNPFNNSPLTLLALFLLAVGCFMQASLEANVCYPQPYCDIHDSKRTCSSSSSSSGRGSRCFRCCCIHSAVTPSTKSSSTCPSPRQGYLRSTKPVEEGVDTRQGG